MIRFFSIAIGLFVGIDGFAQTVQILGGRETTQDWPWMARIIDAANENTLDPDAFICGATLIHPYWVVTAAHCVEEARASDLHVVLGVQSTAGPDRMRRLPVAEIHVYPDFAPFSFVLEHDIALLLLAEPAEGFDTISLVNGSHLTQPGVQAKTIGWGIQDTNFESGISMTLREADLPLVSLELANQRRSYDGDLTANMLPAGYHKGRVDTCQGDSGGPLMVPDETGSGWKLAGVTSFGNGCGDPFQYGIYTRIASYRSWILDFVHPDYGAWEVANGVFGESEDPDGDGRSNFAEYVSNSNPVDPDSTGALMLLTPSETLASQPVLAFPRRATATALDFQFSYSTDLRSWVGVDPENVIWEDTPVNETTIQSRVQLLSIPGGLQKVFIRREASFSEALEPFTFSMDLGQTYEGSLTADFSTRSNAEGSFRFRDFALSIPQHESGALFLLESEAFLPRLELWDRKTMELVARDENTEHRSSARIQWPQMKAGEYILRIGTRVPDGIGEFVLRSAVVPAETIQPGDTIIRTLTRSDLHHFTGWGGTSPVDAFLLGGITNNLEIRLSVEPAEFPTVITLLSVETGETLDSSAAFSLFDDEDLGTSIEIPNVERESGYIVLVSSSDESRFGSYTLKVHSENVTETGERPSLAIGPEETLNGAISRGDPTRPGLFDSLYIGNHVALTGIQSNREVTIDLVSESFDPYLLIIDNVTGETVLENDDFLAGLNSQIMFTLPEGREVVDYSLFVTSAFGDEFGDYTLTLSSERIPLPIDSTITPIELGNSIEGQLASNDAKLQDEFGIESRGDQYVLVNIEPGQRLIIDLKSDDFDPYLWLLEVENDTIIREDDDSGDGLNSQIIFDIPEASEGTGFRLFVTSATFGETGKYQLSIRDGGMAGPNEILVAKATPGELLEGQLTSADAARQDEFGNAYVGDSFELVGLESQQWIIIRLLALDFDPYLWLVDLKDDTVILENDDFGLDLNSQIRFFLSEDREAADFQIFATSARGNEFGDYILMVDTQSVGSLQIGSRVESSIGRDDQRDPDYLVFEGTYFMEEYALSSTEPGTDIHIRMVSDQFVPEVYVIDSDTGRTIAWSKENTLPEATLSFTTEPGENYLIRATTKLERRSGEYTMEVTSRVATTPR